MNRRDLYKRLLASETRWFGSVRDAPKVFDNVTRNHIDPPASTLVLADRTGVVERGDAYYEMTVDAQTGELSFGPLARE